MTERRTGKRSAPSRENRNRSGVSGVSGDCHRTPRPLHSGLASRSSAGRPLPKRHWPGYPLASPGFCSSWSSLLGRRLPKCHWPTYPLTMSPLTKSLIEELEHAPESVQREVLAFLRHLRARGVGSDGSEDVHALLPLAESAWAADWDTPEEDEAWRNL